MFTGPHLNQLIFHTLISLHVHKYLAASDIDRFYNCVKIHAKDSKLMTLLWKKHGILCDCCPFKEMVHTSLSYDMKCAQCVSNLCKIDASRKFILPLSAKTHESILLSYTDDIFTRTSTPYLEIVRSHLAAYAPLRPR